MTVERTDSQWFPRIHVQIEREIIGKLFRRLYHPLLEIRVGVAADADRDRSFRAVNSGVELARRVVVIGWCSPFLVLESIRVNVCVKCRIEYIPLGNKGISCSKTTHRLPSALHIGRSRLLRHGCMPNHLLFIY